MRRIYDFISSFFRKRTNDDAIEDFRRNYSKYVRGYKVQYK